jgi:hypothetical protein
VARGDADSSFSTPMRSIAKSIASLPREVARRRRDGGSPAFQLPHLRTSLHLNRCRFIRPTYAYPCVLTPSVTRCARATSLKWEAIESARFARVRTTRGDADLSFSIRCEASQTL